eukprot:68412-Pelagomonas_calceolata.AAC.1
MAPAIQIKMMFRVTLLFLFGILELRSNLWILPEGVADLLVSKLRDWGFLASGSAMSIVSERAAVRVQDEGSAFIFPPPMYACESSSADRCPAEGVYFLQACLKAG